MSIYTENAKKFKFDNVPNNEKKTKEAYLRGFTSAALEAPLSAAQKLACIKYAADQAGGDIQPVQGPGPGFVPEGAEGGEAEDAGGGDEAMLQQLIQSMPGNTPEEKLHAAVMLLAQSQGGPAPGGGEGIEPDQDDAGQGGGQVDPSIIAHLLGGQGGQPGGAPNQ